MGASHLALAKSIYYKFQIQSEKVPRQLKVLNSGY